MSAANPRPTVSVVICCYTEVRFDDVLRAADSAAGAPGWEVEVVVVVDHNPALLDRLRAARPDLVVIPNDESQGLSGARNSGIAATSGEIVAFLDDDAVAEPGWIEHLAAAYGDERVIGVGGDIVPAWVTERPAWFPEEFDWVVGCAYTGLPTEAAPVRNLIGANMSFRRSVFTAAGGFALDLGRTGSHPYGNNEDTEFCIRARTALPGGILIHEPRARVRHTVPEARTRWSYFRTRCHAEGLAKAALTALSGTGEGLSSERAYVARVLPRAVVRGLGDGCRGDLDGLRRAGAVVAGLAITGSAYLTGRVRSGTPAPGSARPSGRPAAPAERGEPVA